MTSPEQVARNFYDNDFRKNFLELNHSNCDKMHISDEWFRSGLGAK